MIHLNTESLPEGLPAIYRHWIYNGLDTAVTHELGGSHLPPLFDGQSQFIYNFERKLRAPALKMMLRGIQVDQGERSKLQVNLSRERDHIQQHLDKMAYIVWGAPLNPRSNAPTGDLQKFFYTFCNLPPVMVKDKQSGKKRPSVNREALEKLEVYVQVQPIIKAILAIRDIGKLLDVVRSGIDSDGRMRFSFNPASTETGRWSSSKNCFGGGMNAQNITPEMRSIFISDKGKKLAYVDLEQAESRGVGYYSGDGAYIEACESGDLHTAVCQFIWPEAGWVGDLARDRALAERPYYRHFSMRDLAKRAGHATNYNGSAWTIARVLRVDRGLIEDFQRRYFEAFPGIRRWHHDVTAELQSKGSLVTAFGRRRQFLGRLRDDATIREAIAFLPQSLIADVLNAGLLQVYDSLDNSGQVELLAQIHDAILFQYPEDKPEVVEKACKEVEVPIDFPDGKKMLIPSEAKCGYNWRDLKKFGSDEERAQIRVHGDPLEARL